MKQQLCRFIEETIQQCFEEDYSHVSVVLPDGQQHDMINYAEQRKEIEVYLTGEYLYMDEVYNLFRSIFRANDKYDVRIGWRTDKQARDHGQESVWAYKISWAGKMI